MTVTARTVTCPRSPETRVELLVSSPSQELHDGYQQGEGADFKLNAPWRGGSYLKGELRRGGTYEGGRGFFFRPTLPKEMTNLHALRLRGIMMRAAAPAGLGIREAWTPSPLAYRDETFVVPFSLLCGIYTAERSIAFSMIWRPLPAAVARPGPETTRAGPASCDARAAGAAQRTILLGVGFPSPTRSRAAVGTRTLLVHGRAPGNRRHPMISFRASESRLGAAQADNRSDLKPTDSESARNRARGEF
jgi:hypothetical protein